MAKSLFVEADYNDIRSRINNLKVDYARQWGKMDIAQMLAHASKPFEQAIGKKPFKDESNWFNRTIVKWIVLRMIKKGEMGRNSPTVPSFVVADERVFEKEKQLLLENLEAFHKKGMTENVGPHPGFGPWTNEQWGTLQYLHLDHHLKQFSA
jgi:hypothetical protein